MIVLTKVHERRKTDVLTQPGTGDLRGKPSDQWPTEPAKDWPLKEGEQR